MRLIGLTALLVTASCVRGAGQKDSIYPASFASREAADTFAHGLFAGGDIEALKVVNKEVLILIVHGSGVPDIGIAAYYSKNGRWELASTLWPSVGEFHKVIISGNEIVVVGEKTKNQWPFLKVD